MPGELGDEQEQPEVGYYERRYVPDDDPNTSPFGVCRRMPSGKSVLKVLRNFTEERMKQEQGREEYE